MKIAVIGAGIAGNVIAYHLCREHQVTVFEANNYVGGHTHTHQVEWKGRQYAVDTGFIVFNFKTYPYFCQLLDELRVSIQPSTMSFGVKCERSGLEYNGTNLNSLFAQRRNLVRPWFYRMIKDILRFNREAPQLLTPIPSQISLGEYLSQGGYGPAFIEQYLIPMGSAIWSADPAHVYSMPAHFFIRFFHNHGMLSVDKRPTWHTIKGGSQEYVRKLTFAYKDRIRSDLPIHRITRQSYGVTIKPQHSPEESFDYAFIATHSDQALRLLQDPTPLEKEVLSSIPYQSNEAVLHVDDQILPKRKLAWAAWNYHLPSEPSHRTTVTYNMNILQRIQAPVQFCVTLNNPQKVDPSKVIKRMNYSHPIFTPQGIEAQQKHAAINGVNRTYYCGAYWRFGFHEDGVVSALNALEHFKGHVAHA